MTFFTMGFAITGDMVGDVIGYAADLFLDLSPLVLLIVGFGLATIFISAVIGAIRK